MVAHFGSRWCSAYMRHVQDNAEESVRQVHRPHSRRRVRVHDGRRLADLRVAITVDQRERSAVDRLHRHRRRSSDGNFNAPPAVTRAAVLYVFRSPGRQRYSAERRLPEADPAGDPAARHLAHPRSRRPWSPATPRPRRASSTRCSARSGVVACSQATMNNFIFGDATRQYYETICGGAGAGPEFDGTVGGSHPHDQHAHDRSRGAGAALSGAAREFAIRRGSGGAGRWRGGDGAVRRIRFLEPMTAVDPLISPQRRPVRARRRRGRSARPPMGRTRRWQRACVTGTDQSETGARRRVRHRDAGRRRLWGGVKPVLRPAFEMIRTRMVI